MDEITRIKAEVFDILAEQDQHKVAVQQLEQLKQQKLNELAKLLQNSEANKGSEN